MKKLAVILLWAFSVGATYYIGRGDRREPLTIVETHTDTVRVLCPEVTAIYVRGESVERLALATPTDSADSAEVAIPITQAVYSGEDYRAYVSGFRPALDSLVYTRTCYSLMPSHQTAPSRWSIGLQAGYGITPRGFQPFIGIGVSFRIL